MYESMRSFPGGLFTELERLQRDFDDLFGFSDRSAGIRSAAPGTFPAVNVGHTPISVEVYAFAPGIDPSKVEITLDQGVLTLSGERARPQTEGDGTVHRRERPHGGFRRAITLPDDIDPTHVNASYRDGVLQVSIARRESARPQRITIQ